MLRSFNADNPDIENQKLIFDDVYKNSYEKHKLSATDKFFYFKTLYRIKNKYRQQRNPSLVSDVFYNHLQNKKPSQHILQKPSTAPGNYSIQKLNNRLFKINKSPAATDRKNRSNDSRPQSQNLSFRVDFRDQLNHTIRPRLEEIIHKHRSLQRKFNGRKSENVTAMDMRVSGNRSLDVGSLRWKVTNMVRKG